MLDTLIVADTKGSGSRDKDDNEDSDEDHNGENDTDVEKEEDDCPDPKMKLSPITADWDWLEVIGCSVLANQNPRMAPSNQSEAVRLSGARWWWHDTTLLTIGHYVTINFTTDTSHLWEPPLTSPRYPPSSSYKLVTER